MLLALPELLAHSLHITEQPQPHVQNCICLLGQRNGVLRLVRSTRQHLALSLELGHRAQTDLARLKDGARGILDCVILSTRYRHSPPSTAPAYPPGPF